MKAVILCGDCAFAANAHSILKRVGDRPDVNVRWTIRAWPLNVLHHAAMSGKALLESDDANLIIIPAAYTNGLHLNYAIGLSAGQYSDALKTLRSA